MKISKVRSSLFAFLGLLSTKSFSVSPESVQGSLLHMAGCFKVTFNYVEDGVYDKFYAPVLEKSEVTSENPLTFTRTLIVDGYEQLHWTDMWTPRGEGLWHQKVIGPFGDFRYECEGYFISNQWTCTADKAAKPRRDAERPYSHLVRQNIVQINSSRWVHVQNNKKINEDGSLYSIEVGWNQYEKMPDEYCLVKASIVD